MRMVLRIVMGMFFSSALIVSGVYAQEYRLQIFQTEATTEAAISPKIPKDKIAPFNEHGYARIETGASLSEIKLHMSRTELPFELTREGGTFSKDLKYAVTSSDTGTLLSIRLLSPLASLTREVIKETVCDAGCTRNTAKSWNREDVLGWGFSLDGGETYRPFTTEGSIITEPPSPDAEGTLTCKIRLPENNPEGNFRSIISFIALPNM